MTPCILNLDITFMSILSPLYRQGKGCRYTGERRLSGLRSILNAMQSRKVLTIEDSSLPECYAVSLGEWLVTFRGVTVPSPSGSSIQRYY